MKRLLLALFVAAAALTVLVPVASANDVIDNLVGLKIAAGDCGGPSSATWACTANTGNAVIAVASVVISSSITTLTGEAASVEVAFQNPVTDWWKTGAGQCRAATAIAVSYSTALGGSSCFDYWGVVGTGPAGGSYMFIGPTTDAADGDVDSQRIRVRTVSAVDGISAADPSTVQPVNGDDLFLFTLTVNRSKSTSTGSCAGCTEPACMMFKKVLLTQPVVDPPGTALNDFIYRQPASAGSALLVLQDPGGLDCLGVPARSRTWGQIKSLYR